MASSFNHLRFDFVTIEPEWSFIQASETNCPCPQLSRRAFQFSIEFFTRTIYWLRQSRVLQLAARCRRCQLHGIAEDVPSLSQPAVIRSIIILLKSINGINYDPARLPRSLIFRHCPYVTRLVIGRHGNWTKVTTLFKKRKRYSFLFSREIKFIFKKREKHSPSKTQWRLGWLSSNN